ncbi:MAG: hypothetical protein Fur0037_14850 [Planctomycetota bacterium]
MRRFEPSFAPREGHGVLHLMQFVERLVPDFFAPDRPIRVARAPGRLDVMGGIADYSGSLVLQLPIAEAALAAVQRRDDDEVHVYSPCRDGSRDPHVAMRLGVLGLPDRPLGYEEAASALGRGARGSWAAYVLGALLVLAREHRARITSGFAILVLSDVPEGKGVASSAALEVAALHAIAGALGISLGGRELALAAHAVENRLARVPCGVMDQMTAACGEQGKLLALRCQPCEIEGQIEIPEDLEFLGLDGGGRHAVGGGRYEAVRTGAAIGHRILADLAGLRVRGEGGHCSIEGDPWRGFLANVDPRKFERRYAAALPASIAGTEFLSRYGGIFDRAVRVDPGATYAVRAPTEHPILENARIERFRELLSGARSPREFSELGDAMFASHASYTACGLGDEAADWIVEEVKRRRDRGLFGARITGGGQGGTVAILGLRGKAWHEVLRLKKAMREALGHSGKVFRHSSPGASAFGGLDLLPAEP